MAGYVELSNRIYDRLEEAFNKVGGPDYGACMMDGGDGGELVEYLSHMRANCLVPFIRDNVASILEVGSGVGELSWFLAAHAGKLVCLEEDEKKRRLARLRNKTLSNVEYAGSLDEVNEKAAGGFDTITLAGGVAQVDLELLARLGVLVRKGGRIIWVCDNRYGLDNFANVPENVVSAGMTLEQCESLIAGAGFTTDGRASRFYLWPDRLYTLAVYSDKRLPYKGELVDIYRNFGKPERKNFAKAPMWNQIIQDGKFPEYANSYVYVLTKCGEAGSALPDYVKLSNDRAVDKRIITELKGGHVYKCAVNAESVGHIQALAASYENLSRRYAHFPDWTVRFNRIANMAEDSVELEFLRGSTLEDAILGALAKQDEMLSTEYVKKYADVIRYNAQSNIWDIDMIFKNIIIDSQNAWNVLDYEWTVEDGRDLSDFIIKRAVHYFLVDNPSAARSGVDWYGAAGVQAPVLTSDCYEQDVLEERKFQEYVRGSHVTLSQMYARSGKPVWDCGFEFSEAMERLSAERLEVEDYPYRDVRDGELHKVTVDLGGEGTFMLHPAQCCCFVYVKSGARCIGHNGLKVGRRLYVMDVDMPCMRFRTCDGAAAGAQEHGAVTGAGAAYVELYVLALKDSPVFHAVAASLRRLLRPAGTLAAGVRKRLKKMCGNGD